MINYNSIGNTVAKKSDLFKALIVIVLFLAIAFSFMPVKAQTSKPVDKVLKDTTIAGKSYKLYIGSRGGKYTIRTSKTGNVYKAYIKK